MAEKKVIELEIKDNVSSLKSQLRQATAEVALMAEKFGATSKEAADAAKRAAELKDMIADAKDLTDAFNPDAKFNALSSSIGGVLNGFQAYEGALGLIGVESESLQKTMLKVQSAMALSQGIQGALEAKDNFIQLGAVVKNAFAGMTQGAKLFAVTGIGLLVTAIGLVIANWESVSEAIGLSNKEQEKYLKQQKAIAEEQKKQNEFVAKESAGFATLIARLEASNKGSKERKDLIKEINSQYGTTLKNLDDEASFQKQLNGELKNYLEYQRQKYTLQANEEKIQRNLKTQAELNKKLADEQKELEKIEGIIERRRAKGDTTDVQERLFEQRIKRQTRVINDVKEELSNAEKRFESYGRAATKASASIEDLTDNGNKYVATNERIKTATEKTTKSIEENKDATKDYSDWLKENQRQLEDALNKLSQENRSKARENRSKNLKDDIDEITRNTKGKLEAENFALEDGSKQLLQNKKDLLYLEKEAELSNKELTEGEKLAIEAKYKKATEDLDKDYNEKQLAREDQIRKARFQMAYDTLNLISNITELFGRRNEKQARIAFGIDKAAKLASATIAGIEGTIEAYKTAQKSPITAVFPAYPIVQAGLAGAFAATNIAKIAQTQFNANGSSVNSTTPSGGQSFTPQFNVVGSSGVNQLAQVQQQPLKAYITSGDVVSAMSLERNKLQKTSI